MSLSGRRRYGSQVFFLPDGWTRSLSSEREFGKDPQFRAFVRDMHSCQMASTVFINYSPLSRLRRSHA